MHMDNLSVYWLCTHYTPDMQVTSNFVSWLDWIFKMQACADEIEYLIINNVLIPEATMR